MNNAGLWVEQWFTMNHCINHKRIDDDLNLIFQDDPPEIMKPALSQSPSHSVKAKVTRARSSWTGHAGIDSLKKINVGTQHSGWSEYIVPLKSSVFYQWPLKKSSI